MKNTKQEMNNEKAGERMALPVSFLLWLVLVANLVRSILLLIGKKLFAKRSKDIQLPSALADGLKQKFINGFSQIKHSRIWLKPIKVFPSLTVG